MTTSTIRPSGNILSDASGAEQCRLWGQSGKHILVLRLTGFDPEQTSGPQNCCCANGYSTPTPRDEPDDGRRQSLWGLPRRTRAIDHHSFMNE
jgi:hypothetical protein